MSASSKETLRLLFCVAAIYTAYLSWAILQERIATTPYGSDKQIFRAAFVLNTAQSLAATLTGSLYLLLTQKTARSSLIKTLYPSVSAFWHFAAISITSSLASPFGYASLRYIDYPTQILGKSCKLLPVMALGVIVYGQKFPAHKYAVVLLVTIGVALFTLFAPASNKSKKGGAQAEQSLYGLLLLSINLLLDGLTNSTQDAMFKKFKLSGPSMMVGLNLLSSVLVSGYLLSPLGNTELASSLSFMRQHPAIVQDIALFALCGATGQLAIFYTLQHFGSLALVTVTLTRKMFTMLLSVLWFGHALTKGQMVGVALVFGGISAEAVFKRQQDLAKKTRAKAQ
ncbi:UAA transporter [Protomyces lactucae-debilis]|uniref:UDP-galactose transporter homolog 1 n=1 Tax=Protomyces lactucae-debilis TaxID=2754530 RepID=A0A1Y2FDY8_PROLT|nr:UAA transporter [Protomyces lactucae-debilis]ORY82122.1 UAA transporter [Protomyces lactucae-debilis]